MSDERPAAAIEDHGLIGDMHTVALVDTHATIDFLCLWRLDGPSVFCSLLDPNAGSFSITLQRAAGVSEPGFRQLYVPDTNILVTRIITDQVIVEITDFMCIGQDTGEPIIVRRIKSVRGTANLRVRCNPAFGYARIAHDARLIDGRIAFAPADGTMILNLISSAPLTIEGGAGLSAFALAPDECRCFVLGAKCEAFPSDVAAVDAYASTHLERTTAFWKAWAGRCTYRGRYRELVMRSALALKALVSADHGSIAAAATFALPEASAGGRNWDYRYSWIRDSSFAVYAFVRLGYIEEAMAFMHWIGICMKHRGEVGPLQPMYRLDGTTDLQEEVLEHFAGYRGAKPVRIGNGASTQLQLDIYGAFMDAVYLTSKYGGAMPLDGWAAVTGTIEWLCENWRRPDEGIWEFRNGRQPLLQSRVMCWVAIDRAVRLAMKRSLPAPVPRWNEVRAEIHHSIVSEFWNPEVNAFVRNPGSSDVDASALMMPLVRFISAKDPKWRGTQDRIVETLAEDGLVFRYAPGDSVDGISGHEGAFTTCSFWLVECLARQGNTDRAQMVFESMVENGNHLGLFSEEVGSHGEQLGNFPQALTHLSLISAAVALDKALSNDRKTPWE